jgi:hypothetical protein
MLIRQLVLSRQMEMMEAAAVGVSICTRSTGAADHVHSRRHHPHAHGCDTGPPRYCSKSCGVLVMRCSCDHRFECTLQCRPSNSAVGHDAIDKSAPAVPADMSRQHDSRDRCHTAHLSASAHSLRETVACTLILYTSLHNRTPPPPPPPPVAARNPAGTTSLHTRHHSSGSSSHC